MEKKLTTVVVGLSGGVDSALAAFLLKKRGYQVIGAFMKNFSDTKNPFTKECSYLQDLRMAQKIASRLDIPFVIFDFEKEYKDNVIDKMYSDYKKGLTPNPDILCNKLIKFPLFWKSAKKLGADFIAMGHYARIKKTNEGYFLLKGKDSSKDQSYFLSDLSQSDLSHTLFPLGNLRKSEVRSIAKSLSLPNWDRHGTVGICFVGNVPMRSFLDKKLKKKIGKVIDKDNKVIGYHDGIHYYTIGQKASPSIGIMISKEGLDAQKRFYIAKKVSPNTLIVAPKDHPLLFDQKIRVKNVHLINQNLPIKKDKIYFARIRHLGKLFKGKYSKGVFISKNKIKTPAPGQSLVIYDKDYLVASAVIC